MKESTRNKRTGTIPTNEERIANLLNDIELLGVSRVAVIYEVLPMVLRIICYYRDAKLEFRYDNVSPKRINQFSQIITNQLRQRITEIDNESGNPIEKEKEL